jgi:hypothetical protein
MRKLIAVLALSLAGATTLPAQASYTFTNFVQHANGFNGRIEFRNVNQYQDPAIYMIGPVFYVGVSQRVRDFCQGTVIFCEFNGSSAVEFSGAVQNGRIDVGSSFLDGGQMYGLYGGFAAPYRFVEYWDARGSSLAVFGCQVPAFGYIGFYVGRTCDADGYTGSLYADFMFRYWTSNDDVLAATVGDLYADFDNVLLSGPNAMAVVPEPGTYALIGLGLMAIAIAARRRVRNTHS